MKRVKDKIVHALGKVVMNVTDTLITSIVKEICKVIRESLANQKPLTEFIYKYLVENKHARLALAYLPEEAREELINLFSDPNVRKWISNQIDDISDYLVVLLKQYGVPKPREKT